ncbi:MAG: Aconitate hydratase [Ktedonobacterales bacterium]|jgi:aconitase A|nr:MAG: Aconitate hydratase [Ktedonobacterales bacterium]
MASQNTANAFGARATLSTSAGPLTYYRLDALTSANVTPLAQLPFTLRVLVENALRNSDLEPGLVSQADVLALARWRPGVQPAPGDPEELPFMPARVILQDFTGVPAVVDLAAMRDAVKAMGGDPTRVNPLVPADLVIDHSVQVDMFGSTLAFGANVQREYERNGERYALLRWAQQAFKDFSVVPPGTGIVHQVNLEYLGKVIQSRDGYAFPDTLVGTDSHTTMINGLGILGWGVGGIEAEAVLLGQPLYLLTPEVVGIQLSGALPEGATATDLVLAVTQMLRRHGVVGRFVEFAGVGLSSLSLADRATISNMSPEFGATATLFPVDAETLRYLRLTGRPADLVDLVERYTKEQGLFRTDDTPVPTFNELLQLDLATIEPSLAGPRRPQDRVALGGVKQNFRTAYADRFDAKISDDVEEGAHVKTNGTTIVAMDGEEVPLNHGAVAIAAITSCTNTSNPSVMLAAGLLAKHAVERGLRVSPAVKTSLAPGSRAVTDYLDNAGLTPFLEALRFHTVGYGCTTCIAEGTPVLLANGTTRPIEAMPAMGGATLFAPSGDGTLSIARQAEAMAQGVRDCISLVLQDGRTLDCTPDHQILTTDGRWVRADELALGEDRVVVGLEAPLDEPGDDETGWALPVGDLLFTMDTPYERLRTLAFARLLGHLLSDGSISLAGQGRVHVGQAVDREMALNDIELITGSRPAATRYDERKWTIVLPKTLTDAIRTLPGVRVGRRIQQAPTLPAFVLDDTCPVAVVREFLGGLFGADGHTPVLHRWGEGEDDATLEPPAYSQSALPEHVDSLKRVMNDLLRLLARCGVETEKANIYEYPTRRALSSYPAAQDGIERIEVRLELPDGLSFVERVGFRYCVDKALRASAAAVYWRTIDRIHQQRLWMSARLDELHQENRELSFAKARQQAAVELMEREPVVSPHYALLEGSDRFSRLPQATARKFQPLHRESCGFPSPAELFTQLGVREWFAPLRSRDETDPAKRYCVAKDALELPTFGLQVMERREAGKRAVYDLAVDGPHAFVAGTVAVHNCIGNSGPLPEPVADAVKDNDLVVAAVLSGNRNFEGRIHPQVRASYLASPPLVVAYALAGSVDTDLTHDPLGEDPNGQPVYLKDIWPTPQEVQETLSRVVKPEIFTEEYGHVFDGDEHWRALPLPEAGSGLFSWDADSTYVRKPPFFDGLAPEPAPLSDITGARVLVSVGDSITTDHISPAGSIPTTSPAGKYLIDHGVTARDFNSYGARRGNHEVMVRGTFANIRLRNMLVPNKEGYYTAYLPDGDEMTIYDASMKYQAAGTPLLVIAGKEYGSGSSRDWAAKGPLLLGIRATLAESYERIHRSNLVGMGILPLQFQPGASRESLGLTGRETYDIVGITGELKPRQEMTVRVHREDGSTFEFTAIARLDSPIDINYYRNGGILQAVLRRLVREQQA